MAAAFFRNEIKTNPRLSQDRMETTGKVDTTEENSTALADASLLAKLFRKGLIEVEPDLEVIRQDPTSPLHSVKCFNDLHISPDLLAGVYNMGFNKPSKIQERALPSMLADPPTNMIAQSQSGTGKSAAFILAAVSRVDVTKDYPQVLVLAPTYELAIQIAEVAALMAKWTKVRVKIGVRGEKIPPGEKITEHMIFGTPGKIYDWGVKYKVFDMKKISVFILDEADIMIDMQGHQDQCTRIHKQLDPKCQMLLFSATYSEEVKEFAEYIIPNPIVIMLKKEQEALDNIKQFWVKCADPQAKYQAIANIYGVITIGQAIIFCQTKRTAAWLTQKLNNDGHTVDILSSDLNVTQRMAVLDRFRGGLRKVLVATDVLSRGIDIDQVTLVVNYDLPVYRNQNANCESYLHRIGRTGRFGKKGIAVNMVTTEQDMMVIRQIETHFGKKIIHLDTNNVDEIEKIEEGAGHL